MPAMSLLLLTALLAAPPKGQIAYVSGLTDSDRCVYVVDVATRERTRVGPGRGDGAPRWSPDGAWLAFETRTELGVGVYVVAPDGTSGRYLRHAQPINRDPQWSPDGTKLAYSVAAGLDQQIAVYTLESDTETLWGGGRTSLMRPRWLARGMALSLLAPEEGEASRANVVFGEGMEQSVGLVAVGLTHARGAMSTDLFVVTESETLPVPARVLASKGHYAEWAAEPGRGHLLAYESDDGGDREIFVYSRRGVLDLSNHRAADWNPVWAPRNRWLAFESFRDGRRGIYRVHRDTARVFPVAVTANADNWWPSWSPDEAWLVHVSDRSGVPNLFVSEVKGGETIQLTSRATRDGAPAWRPRR